MQLKISFSGKAGSGKDVSVKYLIDKYGGKKISFSKPIYDILYYAQNICGFKQEKDRKFLQWIGTEWGRNINPDIWVELAVKNLPKEDNIYVSDVRFLNEFYILKKKGFISIKIIRNNYNYNNRVGSGDVNHISENDLDKLKDREYDYIIHNNSSLQLLYEKLDHIISLQ